MTLRLTNPEPGTPEWNALAEAAERWETAQPAWRRACVDIAAGFWTRTAPVAAQIGVYDGAELHGVIGFYQWPEMAEVFLCARRGASFEVLAAGIAALGEKLRGMNLTSVETWLPSINAPVGKLLEIGGLRRTGAELWAGRHRSRLIIWQHWRMADA